MMRDLISRYDLEMKLKAFYGVEDGKILSVDAIAALSAIEEAETVLHYTDKPVRIHEEN